MPSATFFNLPDDKRQRILDCALEEFARNDFDSASISQIVAQAGIAKGSLYQYFEDKTDLYRYLLELAIQKKREMMSAVPTADGQTFFEMLRSMFGALAQYELLYPKLARVGYRAVYGKSPLPEEMLRLARRSTQDYFALLIEQARQRGEIRADVDVAAGAYLFTAVLTQLGSYLAERIGMSADEIAATGSYPLHEAQVQAQFNQMIDLLESGLGTPRKD